MTSTLNPINFSMSFARVALAGLIAAATLTACGGGGGGEDDETETLYVALDYPTELVTAQLWQPLSISPILAGLDGKTAVCSADSALPTGITLDSRTCVISGVPSATGEQSVNIRLTVAGYEGSIYSEARFKVPQPTLSIQGGVQGLGDIDLNLPWMQAVQVPASVGGYVAAPGDTVAYELDFGELPRGLALNGATGVISGTVTLGNTPNSDTFRLRARITRGGLSVLSESVMVDPFIESPYDLSYAEITGKVGTAMSFPVNVAGGIQLGDQFTYQLTEYTDSGSCDLFVSSGVSINPSTGEISGTPLRSMLGCLGVSWTVTRGAAFYTARIRVPTIIAP